MSGSVSSRKDSSIFPNLGLSLESRLEFVADKSAARRKRASFDDNRQCVQAPKLCNELARRGTGFTRDIRNSNIRSAKYPLCQAAFQADRQLLVLIPGMLDESLGIASTETQKGWN